MNRHGKGLENTGPADMWYRYFGFQKGFGLICAADLGRRQQGLWEWGKVWMVHSGDTCIVSTVQISAAKHICFVCL